MWLCCASKNFDPDITTVNNEEKEKEKEENEELLHKEEVLINFDKYGKIRDVFVNLNGMFVMVDNPGENLIIREILEQWFENHKPKDILYDTLLSIKISSSSPTTNKNKNLNIKKIIKLEHQIKKRLSSVTFSFDILRNKYSPISYRV